MDVDVWIPNFYCVLWGFLSLPIFFLGGKFSCFFYCFILLVKYIVSHSKSISITSLLKKIMGPGGHLSHQSECWGKNNAFLHLFISMKSLQQEAKLLLKTNLKLWTCCLCHISHTQSNFCLCYIICAQMMSLLSFSSLTFYSAPMIVFFSHSS